MIHKFEVEFKGTMAEFAAWASETFQNAEGLHLTIKVETPVYSDPQSPLNRALALLGRLPFPRDVLNLIEQYVQENAKIQAIKIIRTHTGLGLKEAKDFAETHFFQD